MLTSVIRKLQEQEDEHKQLWVCSAPNGIWLREAGDKGWGVYARRTFREGDMIGECPVLIIRPRFIGLLETIEDARCGNSLDEYVYAWGKRSVALPMGWAAFLNHDKQPNVTYQNDHQAHLIAFYALRKIEFMDELTIDYGYDISPT